MAHPGDTYLTVLVRDPVTLFIHWDLEDAARERQQQAGQTGIFTNAQWALRVHAHGSNRIKDVEIDVRGGRYYLAVLPEETYDVRLGVRDTFGVFHTMLKASPVSTPPKSWNVGGGPDDRELLRLIGMGFGSGEFLGGSDLRGPPASAPEVEWIDIA